MKLIQVTSRNRRDLYFDAKCQSCGATERSIAGYDDAHFWTKVLPDMKCRQPGCGKSTNDLQLPVEPVPMRYPESWQV